MDGSGGPTNPIGEQGEKSPKCRQMSRNGFSTWIWVSQKQHWLPLPRPTPLDSSLSMGRLGKEGISQVAPGKTMRELPKLPVARPTHARGVARGGGEVSGLFLTCRRSFHLAAPKGAESAGPGAGPPLAGPSPEEHSASLASASVTPDSIPLEPLLH